MKEEPQAAPPRAPRVFVPSPIRPEASERHVLVECTPGKATIIEAFSEYLRQPPAEIMKVAEGSRYP